MSGLTDALAASRADESRRAARALLKRPLLRPTDDEFVLVRRHAPALREWFARNTGWQLTVDSEMARLVKAAADVSDPTHPARDLRSKQAFGRRRYVLACLAMAALSRAEAQITLGRLAEQVVLGAADPALAAAGVVFALEGREERADIVAVVRLLIDIGVLGRVAGDEDSFVKETGDVLYDVRRRVLGALLVTPRGPSTVEASGFSDRLAELTSSCRRPRMISQPADPSPADPAVAGGSAAVLRRVGRRRAGVSGRSACCCHGPDHRTDRSAARGPCRRHRDGRSVRRSDGRADAGDRHRRARHVARRRVHRDPAAGTSRSRRSMICCAGRLSSTGYWRRDAVEPGAERGLTAAALARLRALRLVTWSGDVVTARPALARYGVTEPTIQERCDPRTPRA